MAPLPPPTDPSLDIPELAFPPLPGQPADIPWPTSDWPRGSVPPGVPLGRLLDEAFDLDGPLATTQAVVVVHHGRIVAERYAGQLEFFDRDPEPVGPETVMMSWSVAKSVCHAVVGILVGDGVLDPTAPADVPEWSQPDDPRRVITLDDLLTMRDGLDFAEDYEDPRSDALRMLFGDGADDVAAYAARHPLAAAPGTRFHYSSGTTNIVSGIVARAVGPGAAYRRFLADRLFDPIGMSSAAPELDGAGTFVASSSLRATALDYARFGLLALRDGTWGDSRVLPAGWMDHGRRARSIDPDDPGGELFGAHWWVARDHFGTFRAAGYEGQSVQVSPALDLVLVRLGKTPEARKHHLEEWRGRVVEAFAAGQDPDDPS